MNVALLFHPTTITPGHIDDAGYFRRNAQAAAALWAREDGLVCHIIPFDNTKSERARRADVAAACAIFGGSVALIAFFCHGWTDGVQAGFTRGTIGAFADLAKAAAAPGQLLRIALYACSTGSDRFGHDGDNSFADFARDHISDLGLRVQIDCHTTPGDATENSHLRRLESPAGVGGTLLVDPMNHHVQELLRTLWRFRFPFKSRDEITADVSAALAA